VVAVLRAQQHVRRFPWYVKLDVRACFASIAHGVLRAMLRRKLADRGLLGLCDRIIAAHPASPGRSLSIGARRMSRRPAILTDGVGHTGEHRVNRGGPWNDQARHVRAACRNDWHPSNRNDDLGFRVARAQARGRSAPA